jgi:hypothetical protein
MNTEEPITSREFTREMSHVKESLGRIEAHLDKLNGRTATNTEHIAVMKREIQALESVDLSMEGKLDHLANQGCAQYAAHTKLLEQLVGLPAWSTQKKAAAVAGLVGTGALIWPALTEMAKALHAVMERVP